MGTGSVLLGEAVATGEQAAPNGKTFKKDTVFRNVSINDNGDLAFAASLINDAQGLLVRQGASFKTAADSTPAGGGFTTIQAVSLINAHAQIASVGATDKKRVVLYDATSNGRTVLMEAGQQLTDESRQVCNFVAVGLGDSGEVVVHGPTKVSCADAGEPAVDALFYSSGGAIKEIAKVEDPTPIGSTWYSLSIGANVFMNASGHISFRGGVLNKGTGIFLHDPSAIPSSTQSLVFTTDHTPEGPKFGVPSAYRLSNANEVVLATNITSGGVKEGIYLADGGFATILTRPGRTGHPEDRPPSPFASTARYTDFLDLDVDVGATRIAFRAAVLDSMSRARQAVVGCAF